MFGGKIENLRNGEHIWYNSNIREKIAILFF